MLDFLDILVFLEVLGFLEVLKLLEINVAALSVFHQRNRSFGQLVVLGFDVTVFTPTPYQRCSLQRPL